MADFFLFDGFYIIRGRLRACDGIHPGALRAVRDEFHQLDLVFLQGNGCGIRRRANEQGKFLDYSKKLFDNQKTWSKSNNNRYFINYATQLGLNTKQFEKCLKDEKYNDKIDEGLALAKEFGISGTPALFINDKFKGGVSKLEDLNAIIDN